MFLLMTSLAVISRWFPSPVQSASQIFPQTAVFNKQLLEQIESARVNINSRLVDEYQLFRLTTSVNSLRFPCVVMVRNCVIAANLKQDYRRVERDSAIQ